MKIDLFGRTINDYGDAIFNEDGIVDLLLSKLNIEVYSYKNYDISQLTTVEYHEPDKDIQEYHNEKMNDILIPDEYKKIDVRQYVLNKCSSNIEISRVNQECDIIEKRNMDNLFRCMIYLVDVMRKHNIVWGVGRGSSVSSYVLYKIGIHKINSIKYELDYDEFFKE